MIVICNLCKREKVPVKGFNLCTACDMYEPKRRRRRRKKGN